MGRENIGALIADTWERVCALAEYGYEVGTIGYHRGEAYRRAWNFRSNEIEWRRLPHRDTSNPPKPNRQSLFDWEFFRADL